MRNGAIVSIHHLNCCTNRPRVGRFFNGQTPCRVVTHVLLLETDRGLILVDTGMGMDDVTFPGRLGPMRIVNRPRLDETETALKQIEQRGFRANDVRHIVMTHLDLDHAGGLPDFPDAAVHVWRPELEAAMKPENRKESVRYRQPHWAHAPNWVAYGEAGKEPWFGLDAIWNLKGLPPGIGLIPLPGHTRGHCGVAIHTGERWLLHAGDSYYCRKQLDETPRTPFLIGVFQRLAHVDFEMAMRTKAKLRELALRHKDEITFMCSHDTAEFESLSKTKVR
ncbi:MAG: MBL fold metallo-hydrolase [Candidatus Hydrogenedentota bacterium]